MSRLHRELRPHITITTDFHRLRHGGRGTIDCFTSIHVNSIRQSPQQQTRQNHVAKYFPLHNGPWYVTSYTQADRYQSDQSHLTQVLMYNSTRSSPTRFQLYDTYTVMGRRGASQSSKVMWNSREAALSAALLGVPVCSTFLLFHTARSPRFHVSFTTCSKCTIMDRGISGVYIPCPSLDTA